MFANQTSGARRKLKTLVKILIIDMIGVMTMEIILIYI